MTGLSVSCSVWVAAAGLVAVTRSAWSSKIDEHIATLSTYLGHVSPADAYWYVSASPELMALAAERVPQPVRRRAMSALTPAMQAYFTDRLGT